MNLIWFFVTLLYVDIVRSSRNFGTTKNVTTIRSAMRLNTKTLHLPNNNAILDVTFDKVVGKLDDNCVKSFVD